MAMPVKRVGENMVVRAIDIEYRQATTFPDHEPESDGVGKLLGDFCARA
jgi:hypothetical protein